MTGLARTPTPTPMKTLLALCAVSTTAIAMAGSPLNAQSFHREADDHEVVSKLQSGESVASAVAWLIRRQADRLRMLKSRSWERASARRRGTMAASRSAVCRPATTPSARRSSAEHRRSRPITVVDGQTLNVDFAMTPQAVQLDAVVATGYLTQSTRTVTGSVANVNMDNVQSQSVEGIDKALCGPGRRRPGAAEQRNAGRRTANSDSRRGRDRRRQRAAVRRRRLSALERRNGAAESAQRDRTGRHRVDHHSQGCVERGDLWFACRRTASSSSRRRPVAINAPTVRMDYAAGHADDAEALPAQGHERAGIRAVHEGAERGSRPISICIASRRRPTFRSSIRIRRSTRTAGRTGSTSSRATRRRTNLNLSVSGGTPDISGYLSGGFSASSARCAAPTTRARRSARA